MSDALSSPTNPSVDEAAFICPHCRAHCQQSWYEVRAKSVRNPPGEWSGNTLMDAVESLEDASKRNNDPKAQSRADDLRRVARGINMGDPAMSSISDIPSSFGVPNMHLSKCFVCKREVVWLAGRVLYPGWSADAPAPNSDLSADVREDYTEAALTLEVSPRAACALSRLAIQKLCQEVLGREGDINEMIGALVGKGLSVKVQQALDVVRVIGNEAVHPCILDLRDDADTAATLFTLINLIANELISEPKRVAEMFRKLPVGKLKGIEDRDARALTAPKPSGI